VLNASDYRVVRQPRATGDENLQMPDNMIVDLATNVTYGNPLPSNSGAYFDLMFGPSGEVVTQGVATQTLNFWVRDITGGAFDGEPSLICVFTRSGFVGAYPVDPTTPYRYVK
jgi:hypothetical protein